MIKVFEINTKSYSRDKLKPIETNMNLDASFQYLKTKEKIGIKNIASQTANKRRFPKTITAQKRSVCFWIFYRRADTRGVSLKSETFDM